MLSAAVAPSAQGAQPVLPLAGATASDGHGLQVSALNSVEKLRASSAPRRTKRARACTHKPGPQTMHALSCLRQPGLHAAQARAAGPATVPGGQGAHPGPESSERNRPGAQSMQPARSFFAAVPSGQAVQAGLPPAAKVSFTHASQSVQPAALNLRPHATTAAHAMSTPPARGMPHRPGSQATQTEPPAAFVPAKHSVHSRAAAAAT